MAKFIIKGKTTVVGMREFRAILRAADCILRVMNLHPKSDVIDVRLKSLRGCVGEANATLGYINIKKDLDFSDMAVTVIHELYHCYADEQHKDSEWITSTVSARIKADVVKLANVLVKASQRYAAYAAHQKISYCRGDPTKYNRNEDHTDHEKSKGSGFRKHGKRRKQ